MDYFEAIEDYLEAESTVTVNWLANELSIPLTKARELLQAYAQEGKGKNDISPSYLYIGYDADNQLLFQIVHGGNNTHQVKKVLSKQIYSIQRASENISSLIVHSLLHQAESLLLQDALIQERDSFLYNGLGSVKNSNVQVKLFGERVISAQNLQFKRSGSIQGATLVRATSSHPKKQESLPVAVVEQAKSFFEKSLSAPAKPPSAPVPAPVPAYAASSNESLPSDINTTKFSAIPEKRRLERNVASKSMADDSDEEWDIDDSIKRQKVQEPVNEHPTSSVPMEVAQKDGEESSGEEEEGNENAENKPRKKRTSNKKKNILVRGAMDDFMEDAAIEQHKQQQDFPPPVGKTKRVLVEKCSVDDRGYFVTEMVWEEVPDDGTAPIDTSITQKIEPLKRADTESSSKENKVNQIEEKKSGNEKSTAKPLQSSAKGAASKKQEGKPLGGQQKSMKSFFGKK